MAEELLRSHETCKDDFDCSKRHGQVPLRYTSPKKSTIALREKMEDAPERYSLALGPTPRASLAVLRVVFTPLGVLSTTSSVDFPIRSGGTA